MYTGGVIFYAIFMLRRGTQEELIAMKKEVLEQCINKKISGKDASRIVKMHPKAFSRLKWRYIRHGEDVLVPKKPGPKHFTPQNRTSSNVEQVVNRVGQMNGSLGPVGLADKLWEEHGIKMHPVTVWRILKRNKIRYTREYKRWKQEPKLYCLDEPGEELQMDGCYPYGRSRKVAVFNAIDDCSRYDTGKVYDRETTENAIDFVNRLINRVPFQIRRIRVDNRYGKRFSEYCESIGIEVIENDPYSPEQNGKVERFNGTLKRECFWKYCSYHDSLEVLDYKLNRYLDYYNNQRKHGGYGMNRMTPRERIARTMLLSLSNIYQLTQPQKVTLTLQQHKI